MRHIPGARNRNGTWLLHIVAAGLLVSCSAASTDERANACSDPLGCGATGGAATASGGASTASGGAATASGGAASTGGSTETPCTDVRPTGTEWDEATCPMWASETSECSEAWMIDNHYCDESCGRCSGGNDGSDGSGTGGTGWTPSTCTEANSSQCSNYEVGQHCGLTFEIWTDSTAGCMTNTPDGFLAEWTSGNGNYLARKGVRPGSSSPVVTYSADYNPNGNSYLAIYGWTQNPLVEYYIVDSWHDSYRPPGTDVIGTVNVDGGTYEIYHSERVEQPSIEGTKTFWQYWSVRTVKRTSGTITVAPHFAAWEEFGLQMGSFYEVSLVVEGYHSSGSADVKVSFQ